MTAPKKTNGFTREQLERMCGSKVRYADEFAAMAGGMRSIDNCRNVERLYTYHCPVCRGWHLTRSRQSSQRHEIRLENQL